MGVTKGGPIRGWVTHCDCCGKTNVPRGDVLLQLQTRRRSPGENRLAFSTYNSSYWFSTAVDAGEVSHTTNRFRIITDDAGNNYEIGSQTWEGPGRIITVGSFDLSLITTAYIGFRLGNYQQERDAAGFQTVRVGLRANLADYDVTFSNRWAFDNIVAIPISSIPAPDRTSCQVFYDVTPNGPNAKWWLESMSLQFDTNWKTDIETAGAAIVYDSITRLFVTLQACPDCKVKRLRETPGYDYDPDQLPDLGEDTEVE